VVENAKCETCGELFKGDTLTQLKVGDFNTLRQQLIESCVQIGHTQQSVAEIFGDSAKTAKELLTAFKISIAATKQLSLTGTPVTTFEQTGIMSIKAVARTQEPGIPPLNQEFFDSQPKQVTVFAVFRLVDF
jgi:hypothetical protein